MVTLHRDERGALNALVIPLVVVSLLFVGTLVFAFMAFSTGQDYKNNSDEKSAAAASEAVKKANAKQAAEFAEASKSPLKTYNGPAAYGSVQLQYPKTWSGYVVEQASGAANIDGYFNPNVVPSVSAQTSSFALRLKVLGQSYASVVTGLQGAVKSQKLTATPYAFPKVPTVIGTKFTGEIQNGKQGTMVVVPLRNSTIQLWTEGTSATADFNTYILPNFSFSP